MNQRWEKQIIWLYYYWFSSWQSYKVHIEQERAKVHIAKTALRAAYFLKTTQEWFAQTNIDNEWGDELDRSAYRIWLSYTHESLVNANSTLDDFHSLVTFEFREDIKEIYNHYSKWHVTTSNILEKQDELTNQDKMHLTKLSFIFSKVVDFYPHGTDELEVISDAFSRLNDEWKKEIQEN